MRPFIRHRAALLLAAAVVTFGGADLCGQGEEKGGDSLEIRSLLMRLCRATAMEKGMENAVSYIVSDSRKRGLPELDTALLAARLRCEAIVQAVEPLYRQRFTPDELLDIVLFFECPETRAYAYQRVEEGGPRFILGNGVARENWILTDSCAALAEASGVDIWFDLQSELHPLVAREVFLLVRGAVRTGVEELFGELKGPEIPRLTAGEIRAEAAKIAPKKYADIARCLKGAGFRDFLVMTWFQSLEDGRSGRFGEPMPEELLEWFGRLSGLVAARMNEDTLIAVVAPVFDTFFTAKEMKLLADFYQTRAGKSYVQVKLRQYREPERLTEIFMEEFNRLPSKEQDRLIAFRDTEAADKFIMQSDAMSDALYTRLSMYLSVLREEAYLDMIEDADSNE